MGPLHRLRLVSDGTACGVSMRAITGESWKNGAFEMLHGENSPKVQVAACTREDVKRLRHVV